MNYEVLCIAARAPGPCARPPSRLLRCTTPPSPSRHILVDPWGLGSYHCRRSVKTTAHPSRSRSKRTGFGGGMNRRRPGRGPGAFTGRGTHTEPTRFGSAPGTVSTSRCRWIPKKGTLRVHPDATLNPNLPAEVGSEPELE